jgi:hypothetical protein
MTRTARRALAASITFLALLGVASCGSDSPVTDGTAGDPTSTASEEPQVAFQYETNGGCQMMGPNCPTYVVYSDGGVEVIRTGESAPAEITGSIPEAEITAFLAAMSGVDVAALTTDVGPGSCQSCLDGVDTKVTIQLDGGPVVLDSTVMNFDPENDVFASIERLMTDVRAVGELSLQQRG